MSLDFTAPEDFHGFSNSSQLVLSWCSIHLRGSVKWFANYSYILASVGIISNALHSVVLCHKSMRISSTNAILLALSIFDILFLIYPIEMRFLKMTKPVVCPSPESEAEELVTFVTLMIRNGADKIAALLGLSIAVLRALVMRNSMNKISEVLSKPLIGSIVNLTALVLFLLLTALNYFWMELIVSGYWSPEPECSRFYPPNYVVPMFGFSPLDALTPFTNVYDFIQSLLYFLPSVLFPVCSVVLGVEIRKARRRREQLESGWSPRHHSNEHTTQLVAFLTATFLITTLPLGVVKLVLSFYMGHHAIRNLGAYLIEMIFFLKMATTTIHVIICCSFSSLYRETARKMFGLRGEKVFVNVHSNS